MNDVTNAMMTLMLIFLNLPRITLNLRWFMSSLQRPQNHLTISAICMYESQVQLILKHCNQSY